MEWECKSFDIKSQNRVVVKYATRNLKIENKTLETRKWNLRNKTERSKIWSTCTNLLSSFFDFRAREIRIFCSICDCSMHLHWLNNFAILYATPTNYQGIENSPRLLLELETNSISNECFQLLFVDLFLLILNDLIVH